jgi:hypothetical protein
VFLSITVSNVSAQDCGTTDKTETQMQSLPYYGNSQYLNTIENRINTYLNDSLAPRNNPLCDVNREFIIPVKFWLWAVTAGDPNIPSAADLRQSIVNLNTIYRNNGFRYKFVMICPQVRLVSSIDNVTNNNLVTAPSDNSSINVHIVIPFWLINSYFC